MTNCPRNGRGYGHVTVLNFGQMSVISQKRYKIETYFQWKTNRKSCVAYRMAPVLVTLNNLENHFPRPFPVCRPFQVQSVEHLCSILLFQLTALHDQLSPKWAWLRSRDCLKFWANKCYISKTVQDRDILQGKTNRKSYVAYRIWHQC